MPFGSPPLVVFSTFFLQPISTIVMLCGGEFPLFLHAPFKYKIRILFIHHVYAHTWVHAHACAIAVHTRYNAHLYSCIIIFLFYFSLPIIILLRAAVRAYIKHYKTTPYDDIVIISRL